MSTFTLLVAALFLVLVGETPTECVTSLKPPCHSDGDRRGQNQQPHGNQQKRVARHRVQPPSSLAKVRSATLLASPLRRRFMRLWSIRALASAPLTNRTEKCKRNRADSTGGSSRDNSRTRNTDSPHNDGSIACSASGGHSTSSAPRRAARAARAPQRQRRKHRKGSSRRTSAIFPPGLTPNSPIRSTNFDRSVDPGEEPA
jgi:hypothetical protein